MKSITKYLTRINILFLVFFLGSSIYFLINRSIEQNFFIYSNSDLLYLPSFFRDYWEGAYNWKLWVLTPAPYFFPDAFVFFLASIVNHNLYLSFFLYALFFSVLLIFSTSLLLGLFLDKISLLNIVHGVTLCLPFWLILISYYPEDIALFLFPSYHSSVILISLLLYFLFVKMKNHLNSFYFILISSLTLMSDKQLIYTFFFPFFFAMLTMRDYRSQRNHYKVLLYFLFSLVISSIFLKILSYFSIFQIPGIPILTETKKILFQFKIVENVKLAMPEILQFFKEFYSNKLPIFILFLIGTALNIYYAFSFFIKNNVLNLYSRYVLFLYLFSVLSQAFYGIWGGFRYVWGFYFFPFISILFYMGDIYSRILSNRIFTKVNFFKSSLFFHSKNNLKFQAIFSTLILFLILLNIFFLKVKTNNTVNNPYPPFIACLDNLQGKYKLQNGISDYWNAKHIRYLSQTHLIVNQVFSNLEKYNWIHNRDWYNHDRNGNELIYNFIIPERLELNLIINKFGTPTLIEKCGARDVYIYKNGFKL